MRLPSRVAIAALVLLPFGPQSAHAIRASTRPGGDRPVPRLVRFGTAIAFAGRDLLIGRPATSARERARNSGVHLFRRDLSGTWREVTVIAPRVSTPGDEFGAAIVVDGSRMAVGAPGADSGRGAIYLFERDAKGTWLERAKLSPRHGTASAASGMAGYGERFGDVLALEGDRLVAGMPGYAKGAGRVLVFGRDAGSGWSERAAIDAPDTAQRYGLGRAVAISGGRIFVGAPAEPWNPSGSPGSVLIYRDSAGVLKEEARLTGGADSTLRGYGGGLLFDGRSLFVVGLHDSGYLHELRLDTAGSWKKVAEGTVPGANSQFGVRLVRHGAELLVGVPTADSMAGAISVMRYDSAGRRWVEAQHLGVPKLGRSLRVGTAFAAGGEFVALGVPDAEGGEGSVVLFHRQPANGGWREGPMVVDTAWSLARSSITGRRIPCENGHVKIFDCRNVELLSFLRLTDIGGGALRDHRGMFGWGDLVSVVWGWTDSATGREFALVNRASGTAFVEVTDPVNPKYLGNLPIPSGAQLAIARDVKVYGNYAFIAGESVSFGIQVFDLTQLRDVKKAPVTFQATAHYTGFDNAHTLAANPATGFLYAVGSSGGADGCGGGLRMIDARKPTALKFAGCFIDSTHGGGYVHETQCALYQGPDARYRGHEICLNSSVDALVIVDVTDKKAPKKISTATYPNVGYVHQGWLTDDQRYFFLNDEGDERGPAARTRTIVFDLNDLDDPVVAKEYFATTSATDHNLYVRGRYVYESNYHAGLHILDAADPANPKEAGFFDTTPEGQFRLGAWTNYPFFKDNVVAVTSSGEGLFLVRLKRR